MKIDPTGAGERPTRVARGGVPAGRGEHPGGVDGGNPGHASHDRLLVARFVGGDVSDAEADAARELLSACPDCRLLASDLLAISRATSELPAPIRTRDFRISPEEAARLRRSGLRSWLSRLAGGLDGASGRLVPLQRLAAATVAIGLVMAVVTSPAGIPGFSSGGTTLKSAGQAVSPPEGAGSVAGAAPTAAPAAVAAAPAASAAGPAAMAAASAAAAPAGPLTAPAPAATAGGVAAPAATGGPLTAPAAGPTGPPAVDRSSGAAPPSPPAAAVAPVPGPSAQPGVAFNRAAPPTGPVPAGGAPVEAWQVWLLVAAAGLVAIGLIRLRMRRAG